MKKRAFVFLVLAACAASGAFAQAKLAFALDTVPLVTGFIAGESTDTSEKSFFSLSPVFEYALGPYSIGARMDLILGSQNDVGITHFGLAAVGRWYPPAELEKLYLGMELGFDTCMLEDVDDPLYTGLTFALRTGWKHRMGKLFLEPALGYVLSKTDGMMPLTPSGWQLGLNLGMAF
jgi:hypothetical protein